MGSPSLWVAGGAAALLPCGKLHFPDVACALQKPAVLLHGWLSARAAGREPTPLGSTTQQIALKGGSPHCASGAGVRTRTGLNGPAVQWLPMSSSGLCCHLCSGSRAEVALVLQSACSLVKPHLLHTPQGSQGFGGFSFKCGH